MPQPPTKLETNFAFLVKHDEQLLRLGMLAERYFPEDPNTSLLKLRQLAELLAQQAAARIGLFTASTEPQFELIRRLQDQGIVSREVFQLFDQVRRDGNEANHQLSGNHQTALAALKMTWQLAIWFHRTFADAGFKSGPFIPPRPPANETEELKAELSRLNDELHKFRDQHQETAQQLEETAARLRAAKDEQTFWEQIAQEEEKTKAELSRKLAELQATAIAQPKTAVTAFLAASRTASESVVLDEAETRKLIDRQLAQAGWTVDTENLRFNKGTRPQKGKNIAIAEWPTATGPADYVLFVGLTPVAAVEAKRKNKDVSASIQQAKRYSRGFIPSEETLLHPTNFGADNEYRLPFVFSCNGRPFLRQLSTKSGIWFCDVRRPDNHSHVLDGWYSPEGLAALLQLDVEAAHEQLKTEPLEFDFSLRDYQQKAIIAAEKAISEGQREILLAMATGTGKTKTCIALIYRLLKSKRFRRILFLVDRTSLGEQAANSFKDTRIENLQTFADIFGIKEVDEQKPDTETAVHIATIQGMVQRTMYPSAGEEPPTVDQYDCIVVDECHRGYLLDRLMSETELTFRSFEDYISKYRRVLDYYDAPKLGLTATPALHTTDIFGLPVFIYSYREAVIDGWLIDHEPAIQIDTFLSTTGIAWKAGETVPVYDPNADQMQLFVTPDEIKFDIEEFNRKVITKSFNEVVCQYLAGELDPASRKKTLIFCATDAHADLVVDLLKAAFRDKYGNVDDDAVLKITGAADKPLELIRRYRNERNPNVAVTVDLLTTGIDVPEICNIVFLRRVNSRILYDQMIGRATRRCDEIEKDTFRIFDAVRIYEALQPLTAMKPVVVDPSITFTQLAHEMATVASDPERSLVRDQFVAKLQRKKHHLSDQAVDAFEVITGNSPDQFINRIRTMPLGEVAQWFAQHSEIGPVLDKKSTTGPAPIYVSEHEDRLLGTQRGYGKGKAPGDYLQEFTNFVRSNKDRIPALVTVMTRPKELTRKQLRELALELDRAGFSEANLTTAWREMTNQDIAARIVGFIRKAAMDDPLLPYHQRVDMALQKMLASRSWTTPQRQWLQAIAAQTKANVIVDRAAIDDPEQLFKAEGGGFTRLDRIFGGELQQILDTFNESIWQTAA